MTIEPRGAGPRQRSVETGVAVAMAGFALLVMWGSIKAGISWGAEGPRAGFFPFYVAILILVASVVNFTAIILGPRDGQLFADWGQLVQVARLLVPTIIYVALIPWLGIYVGSVLLIAVFMWWLGNYGWAMVSAVSIGVPLITFLIFEKWFLVPLPKGPIEEFLGF